MEGDDVLMATAVGFNAVCIALILAFSMETQPLLGALTILFELSMVGFCSYAWAKLKAVKRRVRR